jgi:hypothetical protein
MRGGSNDKKEIDPQNRGSIDRQLLRELREDAATGGRTAGGEPEFVASRQSVRRRQKDFATEQREDPEQKRGD